MPNFDPHAPATGPTDAAVKAAALSLEACVASGQHGLFLASGTFHAHAPEPEALPLFVLEVPEGVFLGQLIEARAWDGVTMYTFSVTRSQSVRHLFPGDRYTVVATSILWMRFAAEPLR
jgi:hypothetical protein